MTTTFVARPQLCGRMRDLVGDRAVRQPLPAERARGRQRLGGALSETPETNVCRALDDSRQGRWLEKSCSDSLHTHRPSATAEVDFHKPPVALREALALDLMRPLAGTLLAQSTKPLSHVTRVGRISRWKRPQPPLRIVRRPVREPPQRPLHVRVRLRSQRRQRRLRGRGSGNRRTSSKVLCVARSSRKITPR